MQPSGYPEAGSWTARQVLAIAVQPDIHGKNRRCRATSQWDTYPHCARGLISSGSRAYQLTPNSAPPGAQNGHLKRLIRCTQCGHIMSTHITRCLSKLYRYYRCRSMSRGRVPCSGTQIPAGKMEKRLAKS
ncbi:MAG: hypothetical protein C4519_11140 [Desulfobacteraceae bacterium]|nr:MAG: hypothetical protein C4519_11140 [Desulfobacteraceae bacterium]